MAVLEFFSKEIPIILEKDSVNLKCVVSNNKQKICVTIMI